MRTWSRSTIRTNKPQTKETQKYFENGKFFAELRFGLMGNINYYIRSTNALIVPATTVQTWEAGVEAIKTYFENN